MSNTVTQALMETKANNVTDLIFFLSQESHLGLSTMRKEVKWTRTSVDFSQRRFLPRVNLKAKTIPKQTNKQRAQTWYSSLHVLNEYSNETSLGVVAAYCPGCEGRCPAVPTGDKIAAKSLSF